MDVFIARQPIFDRKKRLFAYEILYRSSMENAFPAQMDSNEATHAVLAHVLLNVGLDAITGNRRALINFTEHHLLTKTPLQLPRERCIIEILESVQPTSEILEACQSLSKDGYVLALDDFDFNVALKPLLPFVRIIKVDFQAVDRATLVAQMDLWRSEQSITWLAEKIETVEEFQLALALGFTYFQGHFLDKPQVLRKKTIEPSQIILLNLLAEVCRPEINMPKIESLVAPDVSLSYKLLRYINSVYYSLVRKVESVRYALTYLGEMGVRQFISMAATAEISRGKPSELMRLSMVRAKQCQLLAESCGHEEESPQLYLLGLFSLLDAMLDVPMADLVTKLPLSNELKLALTERTGRFAPYLLAAIAYERGDFQASAAHLSVLQIEPATMITTYLQAVAWADDFEANLV